MACTGRITAGASSAQRPEGSKNKVYNCKPAKPADFAGLLFHGRGSNGKLHRLLPGSGAGAKLVGRLIIPQTGILQSKMDYPFIFGISFFAQALSVQIIQGHF